MAEKPEDLSLPASVVARIIKDSVRRQIFRLSLCLIFFESVVLFFAASRRCQCIKGSKSGHWKGCKCVHPLLHSMVSESDTSCAMLLHHHMLFIKWASSFILFLCSSNNFALQAKRKTLAASDVLSALSDMEFEEFVPELKSFLEGG